MDTEGYIPGGGGVKRMRSEADHSSPSSADVKNGGSYASTSPLSSWHSAQLIKKGGNFTFYVPPTATILHLVNMMTIRGIPGSNLG
jgi:hypothetical protein